MLMQFGHDTWSKSKSLRKRGDVLITPGALKRQGSEDSMKRFLQVQIQDATGGFPRVLHSHVRSQVVKAQIDRDLLAPP